MTFYVGDGIYCPNTTPMERNYTPRDYLMEVIAYEKDGDSNE